MFDPLYAALAAAGVFYLALPVIGAFAVRASWRRFRAAMLGSARLPRLDYIAMEKAPEGTRFRVWGGIMALEGNDRVWIRGRSGKDMLSVVLDLAWSHCYSLPADKSPARSPVSIPAPDVSGQPSLRTVPSGYDEAEESPEPFVWRRLPPLSEGTSVFARGILRREAGRAVLGGTRSEPVILVVTGLPESELLQRCVRQGRQPNEYWNRLTPLSFAMGVACMVAILLSFARSVFIPDIFLLTALTAFLPLSPLLPPGLLLFFLYRALWKRARSLRASRDSVRIPCAAFPPGAVRTILPNGQPYARRTCARPDPACAAAGMVLRGEDEPAIARSMEPGFTCFGVPAEDPDAPLAPPSDPMAEYLAVSGRPEDFARRCSFRARAFTLLAGLCLAGAALLNSAIAFAAIRAFF